MYHDNAKGRKGVHLKERVGLVLGRSVSRGVFLNGGLVNLRLGEELLGFESGNTARS